MRMAPPRIPSDPDEPSPSREPGPEDPSPNHDRKAPPGLSGRPPLGGGRSPVVTLVVWLLVLFALPLILWTFKQQNRRPVQDLAASDFENILDAGRVRSAKIVRNPSTGSWTIYGTYVPETSATGKNIEVKELRYRVQVAYTDALDKMIRERCPHFKFATESTFWSNILFTLVPILIVVLLLYFLFSRQLKAAGRGALQFGKSRARLMTPTQERVTFADVSGIEEAKEEVLEIIDFLRDPSKFQRLGGRIPKGVLMIGPPGTGKTLLARAIAGEADVPFFSISGSDFVEMFVGVGASRVRDMFEEGKRHAPCIIFIDEIDAVGRSRFSGIGGGHDEREQTLNALLVEMDGFEPNTGIIVVAATNRPDVLDPALLRPGRFDRQITIDLPDLQGRLGILKVHVRKIKLSEKVDLEVIARGTPGFSGADLANLVNEAALLAARQNKTAVEMEDLEEARDKVRWGKERRSRAIDERDRRVTAFHEAGHTLVGLLCENAVPLHKVTIVPRGTAFLGATMQLPKKERFTHTKKELEDHLAVLMGGRTAEELIFGDISSGAAMDIRQATDLARKMVCQWGMSEKLGPLNLSGREDHIFLGRDIVRSEAVSERTAREIDKEIARFVREAHQRALDLLTENRDKLELLGRVLLEKETLTAEQINVLLFPEKLENDPETRPAPEAEPAGEPEPPSQPTSTPPPPEEPGGAAQTSE